MNSRDSPNDVQIWSRWISAAARGVQAASIIGVFVFQSIGDFRCRKWPGGAEGCKVGAVTDQDHPERQLTHATELQQWLYSWTRSKGEPTTGSLFASRGFVCRKERDNGSKGGANG